MKDWRASILKEFHPDVNHITIVTDPHLIIREKTILRKLQEKGFEIEEYLDPVEFRYIYETKYRKDDKKTKITNLIILVEGEEKYNELPFDITVNAARIEARLDTIFPNFNLMVLEELDRHYFDELFQAQQDYSSGQMGENDSLDFVLRHIFEIAPELIKEDAHLLLSLLKIHYKELRLPEKYIKRLVSLLQRKEKFRNWDLTALYSDANAFYEFLQERWPVFLKTVKSAESISESKEHYGFAFEGPEVLPFDHHDVRIYIDNLFIEGKLQPVETDLPDVGGDHWIRTGIIVDPDEDKRNRKIRLMNFVRDNIPSPEAAAKEWLRFAQNYARLTQLFYEEEKFFEKDEILPVREAIDEAFSLWVNQFYSTLHSLPPSDPVMVHHIQRYLHHEKRKEGQNKIALIVLDGLSLWQSKIVSHYIRSQDERIKITEQSLFAWIPTLTSVSRQAIFSGKTPLYFSDSINSTNNENSYWLSAWSESCDRRRIAFSKGLDDDPLSKLNNEYNMDSIEVLGAIFNMVDDLTHSARLGSAGMINHLQLWLEKGTLSELIDYLLTHDFTVWITSDHGNIECTGSGVLREGVMVDTKGARARIYYNPELRNAAAENYGNAIIWESPQLPEKYYPLLSKNRFAFSKKNATIVSHGGSNIEEVIVPFIKIER